MVHQAFACCTGRPSDWVTCGMDTVSALTQPPLLLSWSWGWTQCQHLHSLLCYCHGHGGGHSVSTYTASSVTVMVMGVDTVSALTQPPPLSQPRSPVSTCKHLHNLLCHGQVQLQSFFVGGKFSVMHIMLLFYISLRRFVNKKIQ